MNKWTPLWLIHLLCFQHCLQASNCIQTQNLCFKENCCETSYKNLAPSLPTALKVRIAGLWPSSNRFRKIYGNPVADYQLEYGVNVFKCYQLWGNVSALFKEGNSYRLDYSTNVQLWSFSTGISAPYKIAEDITLYGGLGASCGYVKVHNRSSNIHRNESQVTGGLTIKSGILYDINSCYLLDLFIDYLYLPSVYRTHAGIGGLKTGVGIGLKF